jgi:ParB family chromosome partitioning protein
MVEKRRGLGRGLGALIPSAPAEEAVDRSVVDPDETSREHAGSQQADRVPSGGRPADLFFERVTESTQAENARSYSTALRSGIDKNVLQAQSKRVAKGESRRKETGSDAREESQEVRSQLTEPEGDQTREGRRDPLEERPAELSEQSEVRGTDQTAASSDSLDLPSGMPTGSGTGDLDVVSRETAVVREAGSSATSGSNGTDLLEVPGASFADLPLDSIHPNRKQPRVEFNEDELAELVHSIREVGVLQPIVVRPSQEEGETRYELVMGERRWRASREAGMATVPAIIRTTLDDDLLRDALLENLHRSALNPLEEAAAYQQLLEDFGCSHDELAGRLGRSRPQISNTLRLMKLPPLVQRRVAAGVLSAGHARALLGLADAADMEKLAQRIVNEGLSVRSTEEIVSLSGGLRRAPRPSNPREGARHERLDYLATSLSDRLDTNVKITLGAKKGRVSIEFASVDDLNRIVAALSPTPE